MALLLARHVEEKKTIKESIRGRGVAMMWLGTTMRASSRRGKMALLLARNAEDNKKTTKKSHRGRAVMMM